MGIDPKDMVVVSVMPCVAKKFEIKRDDQGHDGIADNDFVISTRELAKMIKAAGIQFNSLPDEEFDPIMGIGSGAGTIFGATGGVMEAALRTVADILTGEDLESIEYTDVRGMEDIKEATYDVAGMQVKVAVTSGLKNAAKLLDKVKAGEADYQFIEVMCCPGGCINGGGQPIVDGHTRNFVDVKGLRAAALYDDDQNLTYRKSHKNPEITAIYADYLGEPGSHKAHELLHTSYVKRPKY